MATDTAFALGILGLLGARAPGSATLLLSALAILDDIGAVLVIGLFYTEDLDTQALAAAAGAFAGLLLLNRAGARRPLPYLVGGVLLWWFILQSGIHATTAGILAALAVPARPYADTGWFRRRMRPLLRRFESIDAPDKSILEDERQHELAQRARDIALKTTTPLQRWESALDLPVSLLVLPLFAFLNAGVALDGLQGDWLERPVMFGTALGLLLGKVTGIVGFAWLGLKLGLCRLPADMKLAHIAGLGMLAGIGFTMSLFVANLAFPGSELLTSAKVGILMASLAAGIIGWSVLRTITRPDATPASCEPRAG
jgi:NhaA family Na+:H+ antiporter